MKNKEIIKCKSYLDHNPVWGGDGYFCSDCMLEFVPEKALSDQRKEIIEKIEKRRKYMKPYYFTKDSTRELMALPDYQFDEILKIIKNEI